MQIGRHKLVFSIFLVTLWLVFTAYAFWWFEFKDLRMFNTDSRGLSHEVDLDYVEQTLSGLLAQRQGGVAVVHFWNPDCYCNNFNQQHVQQIRQEYAGREVHFYLAMALPPAHYQEEINKKFGEVDVLYVPQLAGAINSTPSSVVMVPGKGITYFGPYSDGAMCTAQNGTFVESAIAAVFDGQFNTQINNLAFGCYCDFKSI